MSPLHGKGLWGWLGRQVGYVKKAVHTDPAAPKTVYRNKGVEEKPMPGTPGVKLRRTVIDEVIVDPKKEIAGQRRADARPPESSET